LAMSLATPDKISSLQRKLYGKAKAEPAYRFYRTFWNMLSRSLVKTMARPAWTG